MEEYPAQEEAEESTTSQTIVMDQEVSHSQSDTPEQLEHDVIVIVTDTESENEQEEGDEEEEEQVEHVDCFFTSCAQVVFMRIYIIMQFKIGLC